LKISAKYFNDGVFLCPESPVVTEPSTEVSDINLFTTPTNSISSEIFSTQMLDLTPTNGGMPDPTSSNGGMPDPTSSNGKISNITSTNGVMPDPTSTNEGIPDPTSSNGGIPVLKSTNGGMPDPTSTNGGMSDLTSSNGEMPDPTSSNGGMPDPTSTIGGMPDPTSTNEGMPDPTSTNGEMSDPTSSNGGMLDPTSSNGGMPDPTSTNGGMLDLTFTNGGIPDPTSTNGGMLDLTSSNEEMPDPTSTNGGMLDPTSTSGGMPDPTSTNGEMPDLTSSNVEMPDLTSSNGGMLDPTSTNGGMPNPTFSNGGMLDLTSTNEEMPDLTSTNGGMPNPTSTNGGIPDPTSTNEGIPDPTSTNGGMPDLTYSNGGMLNPTSSNGGMPNPTETSSPGSVESQALLGTLSLTLIGLLVAVPVVLILVIIALVVLICRTRRRIDLSLKQSYGSKLKDGDLIAPDENYEERDSKGRSRLQTHLTLKNGKILLRMKPHSKVKNIGTSIEEDDRLTSVVVHKENMYEEHQAARSKPLQASGEAKDITTAEKKKQEVIKEENKKTSVLSSKKETGKCEPQNDMSPGLAAKASNLHKESSRDDLPRGKVQESSSLPKETISSPKKEITKIKWSLRDLSAVENAEAAKSASKVEASLPVLNSSKEITDSDQEVGRSPLLTTCLLPTSKQDKRPKLTSVKGEHLPQTGENLIKTQHEKKEDTKGSHLVEESEVIVNTGADFEDNVMDRKDEAASPPASSIKKKQLLISTSAKAMKERATEVSLTEEKAKITTNKANAATEDCSGGSNQLPKIKVSNSTSYHSISPKPENWSSQLTTSNALEGTSMKMNSSAASKLSNSEAFELMQDIPRSLKPEIQSSKPSANSLKGSTAHFNPTEVKLDVSTSVQHRPKNPKSPAFLKRTSWDTSRVEATPSIKMDVSKHSEAKPVPKLKHSRPYSEVYSPKSSAKPLENIYGTNKNDDLIGEIRNGPSIEERKKKISLAGIKGPEESSLQVQAKSKVHEEKKQEDKKLQRLSKEIQGNIRTPRDDGKLGSTEKSPPAKDSKSSADLNVSNTSELKPEKKSLTHLPVLKKLGKVLQQSPENASKNPNSKKGKHQSLGWKTELESKIKEGFAPQLDDSSDSLSPERKKVPEHLNAISKSGKSEADKPATPKQDKVDSKHSNSSSKDSKLEPTSKKVPLIPVSVKREAAKKKSTNLQQELGGNSRERHCEESEKVQQDGRKKPEERQVEDGNIYAQVNVKLGKTSSSDVAVGKDGYVSPKDIAARSSKAKDTDDDGYVKVDIPANCKIASPKGGHRDDDIALAPNLAYASSGVNSSLGKGCPGSSAPAHSTPDTDDVILQSNAAYELQKFDRKDDNDAEGSTETKISDTGRQRTFTEENPYEYVQNQTIIKFKKAD